MVTTDELFKMIRNGVFPILEFNKQLNDEYYDYEPDAGMRMQLIDVKEEPFLNDIVTLIFDMKGWWDYNKTFAKANWYNDQDVPCLTWKESRFYPSNDVYEMCVDKGNIPFLDFVNYPKWYKKYIESKKLLTYTSWLEKQLDEK